MFWPMDCHLIPCVWSPITMLTGQDASARFGCWATSCPPASRAWSRKAEICRQSRFRAALLFLLFFVLHGFAQGVHVMLPIGKVVGIELGGLAIFLKSII